MGVTYKLKQEVIDYILELKRVDQSLSCRKVSELASSHFQKTISKSSVNAVLKDSLLSSPVGRRAKPEARAEKFKIPEHRKEQIFINIPTDLLSQARSPEPLVSVNTPASFDNLGALFLKAAEGQMKKQGVLRFFSEKFGPLLCEEKILKLTEALLFLPLFGERNSEKFIDFDKKSLWQLSDIDFEPTVYQKRECYDILHGLETKSSQAALEYGQVFSEASFFHFFLEDGTDFCIDAQNNSSWEISNVHCGFSNCLDKSFDILSKDFIINSTPVILRQATVKESLPLSFFNMISSFENIPGKRIKRIDVMTSQKEIISSFEGVVGKKRYYIAGLYGYRGLLDQFLSGKKKESKHVEDSLARQGYYCWEATTAFRLSQGQQVSADIALVSQKKDQNPIFAILTNIPPSIKPIEKVVSDYLKKWPSPLAGQAFFVEQQGQSQDACCDIVSFSDDKELSTRQNECFEERSFLDRLSNSILLGLHDYCARHFFHPQDRKLTFAQAQKKFYSLSGELKKEDHFLRAKFILPEGYPHQEELRFLLQRVNESVSCGLKARRLVMEI